MIKCNYMKHFFVIVFFVLISTCSYAQNGKAASYYGDINGSILVRCGENGVGGEFSTSHGVTINRFSAGAGIGVLFDCYQNASIPVFLDWKYRLSDDAIAPFVAVRGGCWVPYDSIRMQKALLFVEPRVGLDVNKMSFLLSLQNMNSKDERESYLCFSIAYRFGK